MPGQRGRVGGAVQYHGGDDGGVGGADQDHGGVGDGGR